MINNVYNTLTFNGPFADAARTAEESKLTSKRTAQEEPVAEEVCKPQVQSVRVVVKISDFWNFLRARRAY